MPEKDEIRGSELKMLVQVLLLPVFMLGYIGAQTGSLIIQAVIAASVGIAVAVKLYWSKIRKLFTKGKSSKEVKAGATASQDSSVETEALLSVDAEADEDTSEDSLLPAAEKSDQEPEIQGMGTVSAVDETGVEE